MGLNLSRIPFIRRFLLDHFHYWVAGNQFFYTFGRKLDWEAPRDINEKIQWLIRYSDTSLWTLCSDKLRVRDFVAQRGLAHLLTPLLGAWERGGDIAFDALPDRFVLKCNHDSGSCLIVDKRAGFDRQRIVEEMDRRLQTKYGYVHGEMWYNGIKPMVIAEEYLEQRGDDWTTSLVDYKIWCFDGKPYSVWACHSRTAECTYVNIYDLDWRVHPEVSVFTDHYRDGGGVVPRPACLDEMLAAAATLSKGFPEVRADFYVVDGRLYFGELTFASLCGLMDFYTKEYLEELGDQVTLPPKRKGVRS